MALLHEWEIVSSTSTTPHLLYHSKLISATSLPNIEDTSNVLLNNYRGQL